MTLSQNGYEGIESYGDPRLISNPTVPGSNVKILGGVLRAAAPVLLYVAARFNREVEALDQELGQWGYNYRPIRGASTLSNHSSGTAIDLNAVRHPLGVPGTFNQAQRAAIRQILNDCGGLIRWGGDYSGRVDEMHFEVNATQAQLAELARRLSTGLDPGPTTPAPVPTPTDWWDEMSDAEKAQLLADVADIKNKLGWLYQNETLEGYQFSKTAANFEDTRAVPGQVWGSLIGERTAGFILAWLAQHAGLQVFGLNAPPAVTYGVVPGDTFGAIAKRFGVTQDALKAANPGVKNPDDIAVGLVLVIPKG